MRINAVPTRVGKETCAKAGSSGLKAQLQKRIAQDVAELLVRNSCHDPNVRYALLACRRVTEPGAVATALKLVNDLYEFMRRDRY
jgi:hypothetical protein